MDRKHSCMISWEGRWFLQCSCHFLPTSRANTSHRHFLTARPLRTLSCWIRMSKYFRPEFLGRLTEIVPFAPMNLAMVEHHFQDTGAFIVRPVDQTRYYIKHNSCCSAMAGNNGLYTGVWCKTIGWRNPRPIKKTSCQEDHQWWELSAGDEVMLDINNGEAQWRGTKE